MTRYINKCKECKYYEAGFLSEPAECGYFHKPYEYFISIYINRDEVPKWCPKKGKK